MRLEVKPLSINEAYNGRRTRSKAYNNYKNLMTLCLPCMDVPKKTKLEIRIKFGFSSKGSDVDNCVKPFIDCLQETYGFNDNMVYKLDVEKIDVKKGKEFIECSIFKYLQ